MRALILTSLATLLATAPLAQPEQRIGLEHAGLAVDIPADYVLQTTCEIPAGFTIEERTSIACDALPVGASDELQTALYVFIDEPQYRFFSVAIRNDLTEEERSEWVAGTRALGGLAGTFTPADASEWTEGSAAAATWTDGLGGGIALYGCEGWRCYRLFAIGPASDLNRDPTHYREVLAGVTVQPLAAPVARGGGEQVWP